MNEFGYAVQACCDSEAGLLTRTELGTAGFSRKECSRMDRGGPYRAGSSIKWACWNMWSMGHTNGSSSRPPPGALHLSNGALQAVPAPCRREVITVLGWF